MKVVSFIHNGQVQVGCLNQDGNSVQAFILPALLARNGALVIIEAQAKGAQLPPLNSELIPLNYIKLLAPIPYPRRNIFCVGKNYLEHVYEVERSTLGSNNNNGAAAPGAPIIFSKVPQTVIGSGSKIPRHHPLVRHLDYEAELAVIIGRGGKQIAQTDALNHIWGYTIINDVTARDLQKRHQQWHIAKSLDGFCPMGPWIVSADEVDPSSLRIKCWVNDELRQDGSTKDMIFNIAQLIETISAGITLYPGDIIATGTPSGVGMSFNPPRFLNSGDMVTIEIEGIGGISNQVEE